MPAAVPMPATPGRELGEPIGVEGGGGNDSEHHQNAQQSTP